MQLNENKNKKMIHKLDRIDLKILHELQEDGSLTNIELSRRVGVSPPPCLRRVKNLENSGLICSYHADLNASALGFGIMLFCEVGLVSQNENDLYTFEETIRQWPLVREAYMITGGYDFLLKIIAKNFESYQSFLSKDLGSLPNVNHIKTRMIIRISKKRSGIPVDLIDY